MEEYSGTNIEKVKGTEEFLEVEKLIKETLEETKRLEKPQPAPAAIKEEFKATSITLSKKEAPPAVAAASSPQPVKKEESSYNATFKEYQVGDIIKATVLKVDPSGVLVDIKYKADGLIPPEELSDKIGSSLEADLKVGDVINVYVMNLENKEGYAVVSKKMADYEVSWKTAYDALKNRKILEGKVVQALRGGLVVDCLGIKGFIPASQVQKEAEETLEAFNGRVLPVKVIEVNRRQGKIVMSSKVGTGEKERLKNDKLINELEVGQVRHGKVASLKSFGAFVDLGGIEGLIHLSELSWKRVKHPSELLKTGQELDVFVLGVDKISKKVALGLKELQPDPWASATQHYKPGMITTVKVLRFAKFGAFVELDHSLEGLIHVSEISKEPVQKPEDALKIGDVVEVKVLRVIPEEQKIGLSIKEAIKLKEAKPVALPAEEAKKVTIGDMIAQKEKERAERESEETVQDEEASVN